MQPQTEASASKITLQITYNGITKPLFVEESETVKSALDRAIKLFGATDRPHVLSLFFGGNELNDASTIGSYRLPNHASVQLRPGVVKGGSGCAP